MKSNVYGELAVITEVDFRPKRKQKLKSKYNKGLGKVFAFIVLALFAAIESLFDFIRNFACAFKNSADDIAEFFLYVVIMAAVSLFGVSILFMSISFFFHVILI